MEGQGVDQRVTGDGAMLYPSSKLEVTKTVCLYNTARARTFQLWQTGIQFISTEGESEHSSKISDRISGGSVVIGGHSVVVAMLLSGCITDW